jgi:hypothetical protein
MRNLLLVAVGLLIESSIAQAQPPGVRPGDPGWVNTAEELVIAILFG